MKRKGNFLKYLLAALFLIAGVFVYNIPKAYAASAHTFSYNIYNCYALDEELLTDEVDTTRNRVTRAAQASCLGPNGDGNAPLMTTTNVSGVGNVIKLEPGQVIKVGLYYQYGDPSDYAMQVKAWFDTDAFEAVNYSVYDRSSRTFSDKLATTKVPETNELGYYDDYTFNFFVAALIPKQISGDVHHNQGMAGYDIMDDIELIYIYFKAKDTAPTNTKIDFTWDKTPGTGTWMNNASTVSLQDKSVYIEVPLSTDNSLGSLSITNGSTTYPVTPTFTPGSTSTTTYTAYVPYSITSANIAATANDAPKATITGTGNKTNLKVGNNNYTLTVLSEAGVPKEYTIKIYRLNNNANLSTLGLTNVSFGQFNPSTTSYTATVPYTTTSTTVSATAADSKATLESGSTGNKNLSVGSNPISVKVNAENCKSTYSSVPGNTCTSKTYTVNVTREAASTISTLNDLLVDGSRAKGFTPGDETKTYTLDPVASTKANIAITYVKGQDNQTVTGDGTKTLSVGDNTFPVVVTAQDGTTKTTYTLKIHKKSGDNTLKSLSVTSDPSGTLSPSFASNKTDYHYNVDADENEVNIAATANHSAATVKIYNSSNQEITNGKVNPRTSPTVTVKVTPEDTAVGVKTYTITFDIAKSKNNNLSDLKVDGSTVDGFSANTTLYELTVPTSQATATIAATLADDRATLSGDTGAQTLAYGENTFNIVVTPEDPNTQAKTYTVKITRTKKNISTLSDLKVDGTSVPGFSPSKTTYTLDAVASTKANVIIAYTKSDTDATVTGDGTKTLSVGDNALKVVVTAQNGTDETTYTINIHKKSGDNTLKSLSVTSDPAGTLSPSFASNKTDYHYDVDADENEVNIAAAANHSLATVNIYNSSNQEITNGRVNPRTSPTVTVKVTPEDESIAPKNYTITFDIAKSKNNNLSDLKVDGSTVSGFSANTTLYELTVPTSQATATIAATPQDDRATVSGDTGTKTLAYGENTFNIVVTPEDPNTQAKTYTVKVTRTKKNISTLSDLKVDGTTVPDFSPSKLNYTIDDRGSSVESVNITYTKSDTDATATGDGIRTLSVGDNALKVIVTAQNGINKSEYIINVKRKSSDNTLKSLTVTSSGPGSLDSEFTPGDTEYVYTVGPDETSVTVSGEANNEFASVAGGATVNPRVTPSVQLVVTPEDGVINTYTVTFNVTKSTNANLGSITIDGEPISGFDPDVTTYNVEVGKDVGSITVDADPEDEHASVDGTGSHNLGYGDNTITITVTPEDPNEEPKEYTIIVTREKKSNADLESLSVDGTPVPGFDPDTLSYTLDDVATDKESVEITYTKSDTDATVTGDGVRTLVIGNNPLEVTVTAQNGTTTKTYTINIKRKSSDSTLKSLTVTSPLGGTLEPDFDPTKTSYTYTTDPDETEVTIGAEENQPGATVDGTGTFDPRTKDKVEITVTSENGTETVYTINLVVAKSTNANLSDLEVEGFTITPDFDEDELSYSLSVPASVDSVNIIATLADDRATVDGDGDQDLIYGSNPLPVVVTAEDGTTSKTYTIVVTRALSDDVKLTDLTVDGTTVPGFDPDVPAYDLGTVSNDVTSVIVDATASDPNATITGTGVNTLLVGRNDIVVEITAQDDTTKGSYTITIYREANSNSKLSSLEVEGYSIDPDFDEDEISYTLTVGKDVESVNIIAEPVEDTSTVTGDGAQTLTVGENTFPVVVTAEDQVTSTTYTIVITREADTNNNLSGLEVEGYSLDPVFDPDETEYTLTVPTDVDSVTVTATPESDNATVEGTGTIDLGPDGGTIEVTVKAQDGTEKTYTIVVTKADDAEYITSYDYGHIIEDGMIKTVAYKTLPETLKDQLDNENWKLKIFEKTGTDIIAEDQKLGTGMVVKLIVNDNLKDSKLVVVKGDVDGNSEIALLDAVMVLSHYLEKTELQGVWFEAADTDSNNEVALLDAVNILKVYISE